MIDQFIKQKNNYPRFKICCISNAEEAQAAIRAGASAIGLVGPMPSGPGVIDDSLIRAIAASIPHPIATFLLTSETDAEAIIKHHRKVNTSVIQLVDKPQTGAYKIIKQAIPWLKIVQVIHVINQNSVNQALEIAPQVDALLLDSGNPNLNTKELGGTGRVHNWELSRTIIDKSPVPVFLAGGLNAENVSEALKKVRPFALDICSGVRTNGRLDQQKLDAFVRAIWNTYNE